MRLHPVSSNPRHILLHYALGDFVGYIGAEGSPTSWFREKHRGVHLLKTIAVPKGQRRYVFSPKFEIRYNTAFERVLMGCADPSRTGFTWIIPPLMKGYMQLHEMGFAHSFEAWLNGELVGGCFGVQIGGYISVESMYHKVSHASKAAYGQTLMRLKERGFALVDSNPVSDPSRNYGEEWIPQWRFEKLLQSAMRLKPSLIDGIACPCLPRPVRLQLPLFRFARKVRDRLWGC